MSILTTRDASACVRRFCLVVVPLVVACAGTATNTASDTTDLSGTTRPIVFTAEHVIEVDAGPERLIELREADGLRWLAADDVSRYTCDTGVLVCQSAAGRRATRLCGCLNE